LSTPRYFIPHAASPAEPVRADPSAVVHAVDAFSLEVSHLGEHEWMVCTDVVGNLLVVPASERDALPASVQTQLTHHEVAAGRPPRRIAAAELFFFSVELVEHPANAEGLNDPVYLYGTLMGPFPGDAAVRVPGQLTLTRGDVLSGLVHGAAEAFHYVRDAEGRDSPRGYHALLPGDRAERLAEGRGLVLAYPAVPAELQASNVANGPQVASILHDVLTQLQDDARAHGGPEALVALELPVPSRVMAIAELEMRGYDVTGDVATLRSSRKGLAGKVAEWLHGDKVKVPREAPPSEFLELARRALAALPGWPSESERVLRSLVRAGSGGAQPRPVQPPRPTVAMRPPPPRAPPAPPRPSDWMKDFLDAHAATGGAQPKLTRMQQAPRPSAAPAPKPVPPAKPSAPTWLSDFAPGPPAPTASAAPAPRKRAEAATSHPEPAKKPDWMKDFDD
jgi:hypothetical protein